MDIPGSTEGRTVVQAVIDAFQAAFEAGEGYPELDGEIITRDELISRGGSFIIEDRTIVGYLDADGNELPIRQDVFFYVDQFYSTDTLTLIDGIYYDTTGSRPVPLGVTFDTVLTNLDTILQRAVDLRELDHEVELFLDDDVIASLSHVYGTDFDDTFIVSSDFVTEDVWLNFNSNLFDDTIDASATDVDLDVLLPGSTQYGCDQPHLSGPI